MATDKPTPPEGARKVAQGGNDDDDNFELSPGEEVTARVLTTRSVETEYGESGILTLELEDAGKVVDYFAKDEAKQGFNQGQIERGDVVWLAKGHETESLGGNEYYPTMCRVLEAGN